MKKICTFDALSSKSSGSRHFLAKWWTILCLSFVPFLAFAQTSEKHVTVKMTDVPLSEVLIEIRNQSGARLTYSDNELDRLDRVSVDITNRSVREALNQVLTGLPLKYEYNGSAYVITPASSAARQNHAPQEQPARRVITGKVLDNKTDAPLPGATVLYEEAYIGGTTDSQGNFRLIVPTACRELLITFIGYEPQKVSVVDADQITVRLVETASSIDEVVVTGIFNKDKDSFTGSVTSVTREELRQYGNVNLIEALRFVDPSFKVAENNTYGSDPNRLPDFLIRGEGSFLGGSNLPTFIVDGYEVSAQTIFDMDLDRIESITILKDASATILYGSRAANGVIVIETRRPEQGKLQISYANRTSLSFPDLTSYNLMNAEEKLEYEIKAGLFDGTSQYILENLEEIKENVARGVDTDWLAQPTRTGVSHAHSLYLQGGSDAVLYGLSANYNRNNGTMKKSFRETIGVGFDMTYRIANKISIRNSFSYSQTNTQNSPYGTFSVYAQANPYNPIYDDNGNLVRTYTSHTNQSTGQTGGSSQYSNPLYDATLPYKDETQSSTITNNLNIHYFILDGLQLRASLSLSKGADTSDQYVSPDNSRYEWTTSERKGQYKKGNGKSFSYDASLNLSYSLSIDKNVLFAGAGMNLRQSESSNSSYSAMGFSNPFFNEIWFAQNFLNGTTPTGNEERSRSVGFYFNVNYSYDNRYYADFSSRFDGSSKYGKDNPFSPFYALGLGWNIHNEKFLKGIKWLSQLRLRGSFGITGNQNFSSYLANTTLQYNTEVTYGGALGASYMSYGNSNLKWQQTYNKNIGLDMELADRRLTLRAEYYNDRTKSVLLPVTVTPSLGFTSYTENFGEVKREGIEFDLGVIIIRKKDFDWAVNFSGNHNRSIISKISDALRQQNDENKDSTGSDGRPLARYFEGQSMNIIEAVRSLGINPATGNELFLTRHGEITEVWDSDDLIIAGTTDSDLEGNISTNIMWKNLSLNMSFRYSFGAQAYNSTLLSRVENSNPRANADKRVLSQRWQQPGDRTFFRNIASTTATRPTTRFVQDNNYFEIGNIALTYRLTSPKLKRVGISNARIGLSSNNAYYFGTIKRERGTSYPFAREFTLSINLTF